MSEPLSPAELASNIVITVICVCCAGLASGLTQGLLSLSKIDLEIKKRTGTELEKKQAEAVTPLVANHHLLLVTLLLLNATAMEMLPLALDKLVPEFVAIILSVTLVLVIGEIVPAALMTGPYQFPIVTTLVPFVYFVLIVFYPVAWPLSKLLDAMLGHDEGLTTYNRIELRTMVRIQHEFREKERLENQKGLTEKRLTIVDRDLESGFGVAPLDRLSTSVIHLKSKEVSDPEERNQSTNNMEINMIDSVLRFRDTVVKDAMTPDVFMLSMEDKFSFDTLNLIFKSGYSRIPVYEKDRNDVVGLILAKDLLFIDPEDELPMRSFMSLFCRPIQSVWPDDRLTEVLKLFKQSHGHMAIVRDVNNEGDTDPFYEVIGIITLEDVLEIALGEDIMDETDVLDENNQVVKDKAREVGKDRMKLLMPSMLDDAQHLSTEEVRAIAAHLVANVPSVSQVFGNEMSAIEQLVKDSVVIERDSSQLVDFFGSPLSEPSTISNVPSSDVLFTRGIVSNLCILILSGKVTVLAGKDEFRVERGPWSAIGQDSLTSVDHCFTPDFSAFVASPKIKYLQLSRNIRSSEADRKVPSLNKRKSMHKAAEPEMGFGLEIPDSLEYAGNSTNAATTPRSGDAAAIDNYEKIGEGGMAVSTTSRVPGLIRHQSFSIRRKSHHASIMSPDISHGTDLLEFPLGEAIGAPDQNIEQVAKPLAGSSVRFADST